MPRTALLWAELNARLPLEVILAELGMVADARGRYWCPYHPDERPGGRPSADIWEADDGEELLGCWSCGARVTGFELIAHVRGVSSREAVALARVLAEGAPARAEKPAPRELDPAKLERELRVSTTGVRYPRDVDPLERFAESHGPLPPVEYLRSWGWAGDFRGQVVMPWRDEAGTLTGLRFRVPPSWVKSARPGSRFRQLYGVHRTGQLFGGFRREMWLCEGETDAVHAAWHLEPVGVAVVAVGGVTQRPCEADLELLAGRRVVIAFDPDHPGTVGRARWASALAGRAEVVHLHLDDGKDLRRSAESPLELRDMIQRELGKGG